jgi:hypothetical protein
LLLFPNLENIVHIIEKLMTGQPEQKAQTLTKAKQGWCMTQVVEPLPSKHQALSSNSSTTRKQSWNSKTQSKNKDYMKVWNFLVLLSVGNLAILIILCEVYQCGKFCSLEAAVFILIYQGYTSTKLH